MNHLMSKKQNEINGITHQLIVKEKNFAELEKKIKELLTEIIDKQNTFDVEKVEYNIKIRQL